MSFFGTLFGLAPKPVGPPQSAEAVRAAILAVNRPTAPFVVRPGGSGEADLVAEWKIVDADWYEIFAKAHLEKAFKISMRLDEANHDVRSIDQEFSIDWRLGAPRLSFSASAFRGRKTAIEFGTAYGFTETLGVGRIYNYRFSTREMKGPLQAAIAAQGWRWRGVAFGKL